jgi:hypothetical protein
MSPILYTPDRKSGKKKRSKIQEAWGDRPGVRRLRSSVPIDLGGGPDAKKGGTYEKGKYDSK